MLTWLFALLLAGVNVNTATPNELEALPGIGPSKAAAIVDYREANGPYGSLNDLDAVPGIGPSTLANISSQVEFGDGAPAENGATTPTVELATPPPQVVNASANAVNVNAANSSQLESLPGIGPAKARAIIEDREANGPFGSCSDLTRVNGVGEATVKTIGNDCTVQ